MNCHDLEPLILAERDGVLTTDQLAALTAHLAGCTTCAAKRARVAEAALFLKTEAANVPVPDADAEWSQLQARRNTERTKPAKKRPLAPVIWFGAPLAAAAALALAFLITRPPTASPEEATATIAYVDKESGWLVVWTAESGGNNG